VVNRTIKTLVPDIRSFYHLFAFSTAFGGFGHVASISSSDEAFAQTTELELKPRIDAAFGVHSYSLLEAFTLIYFYFL
jgi:hypothetical protein